MKKPKEEQRRCDGKLVCPGCNTTLAIAEIYGTTDERGFKFHNLSCLDKYQTRAVKVKDYAAGRIQTTQPIKNPIAV